MLRSSIILCCSLLAASASAQEVSFESPEGWAMAYTSTSTFNLGHNPPNAVDLGDMKLSATLSSIPRLSELQQRVGFGGAKDEDLNKSPVFGRIRFGVGLIWDTTLELSWTPPIEISGAQPQGVWGAAISRPVIQGDNLNLGVRLFATTGDVEADVTCSGDRVNTEPYSPGNTVGCIGASKDRLSVDHMGAEAILSYENLKSGITPWFSFASTRVDSSVKIDAPLSSGRELATIRSDGTVQTYSLGFSFNIGERQMISLATSYTPLDVERSTNLGDRDSFWNYSAEFSLFF